MMKPRATTEILGKLGDGTTVHRIGLWTDEGKPQCTGVNIITFGATIQELRVPNKNGEIDDLILGFEDLEGYLGRNPCMGSVPGRIVNRIRDGELEVEGIKYQLERNWPDGKLTHCLHGGARGYDKRVWSIVKGPWVDDDGAHVTLGLHSPAGDAGFPGNLDASVTYRWTVKQTLEIEFSATCDRASAVNLTNHAYFNLAGVKVVSDVLQHKLLITADKISEVDHEGIPTGKTIEVTGTPWDFKTPSLVGERIHDSKLVEGGGYDYNYWVNGYDTTPSGTKRFMAAVSEPSSGRKMEVWSTQPGVQLFTSNHDVIAGIKGKFGVEYPKFGGICLETQHFPDSTHHPHFPSIQISPAKPYNESCSYRFSLGEI